MSARLRSRRRRGSIASQLLNGVEYARASAAEEPKLRASWKRRQGGGATPLVLVADDPEQQGYLRILGPQRDGPMRRVRNESLLGLVERTVSVRRPIANERLRETRSRGERPVLPQLCHPHKIRNAINTTQHPARHGFR